MLFEPFFGDEIFRAGPFDFLPEPGGMVHLAAVHQFMQDDVIADEGRCLDQSPVQGNRAVARTGTPAGTLVADGHALHGQLLCGRQLQSPGREFRDGQPP